IETDATSNLSAQIANMTSLLQTIALNNQGGTVASMDAMNTVNATASVSCVQCGEGHLYDMCPYNPQSVCYVQNNPYAKTYNPGWRNHLNFGWGRNQQQTQGAEQQPQRGNPPGFNQGNQGQYHQFQRDPQADASTSFYSLESLLRECLSTRDAMFQSQIAANPNLEVYMIQMIGALENERQGA
ncbi:hypothetical protein, partial [Picosynechococcus sp. PCC 7002]|uniref:hypothetical protein n=1 Tax=Picosynechococcus sp. (strain ATCC 27264 / PCC 7002 / PR-6) TaxID=32049 RepID=UPI001C3D9E4F